MAAPEVWSNLASAVVSSGGTDAPSSGTVETFTMGAGYTTFPDASTSSSAPAQFRISDPAAPSEIMLVTSGGGNSSSWTVTRGAEGTTPVAHTSGFTVIAVITAGSLTQLPGIRVFNAKTAFGAAGNGTTNDTTAVQAAITAAGTSGGVAYFPAGTYLVTNLTVPSNVMILGDGPGATVFSVSSSTTSGTSVFSLAAVATTRFCTFRDFSINGNGVAGVTGVSITNTGLSPSTPGFHRLWNLVVENMGGDGYYYENQIETYTIGCLAFQITGYGFNVQNGATDSRWVSCTAGAVGEDGFYVSGSNCHYVACKAYYAGYNYSTGAWGTGAGWHVDAISTYFSAGITFNGCEAQDCSNNGWFFDSSGGPIHSISMTGCTVDSCNAAGGAAGALSSGIQTNGLVNSSIVGNSVFNRSGGAGTMPYYLSVAGTQTGTVIALNNAYGLTDSGIYYVSGYGYLLLEQFETDFSGSPIVKVPSLIGAVGSTTALSTGTTITFNEAYAVYPVSETANVTGIIMGATGAAEGQVITILNLSAFTVTFAASGSNVIGGSNVVIPADSGMSFVYDSGWYPITPPSSSSGAVSSVFGRTGAVVAASGDYTVSEVTGAAPLASPALTGTPTAPTATAGTDTTQIATTAFVQTAVTDSLDALGNVSGTATLTVTTYGAFTATLTGNTTFSFSGSPAASSEYSFDVFLTQNSTGGYTASWPSSVTWLGGEPVVNAAAGALSILTFTTLNGGTNWYGSMALATSFPISTTDGGTGLSAPAENELLLGPSSSGGALQSIASSGTSGYVLTDNGTGVAPSFQAAPSGGSTQAASWLPSDEGLLAASFDPISINGLQAVSTAYVYFTRIVPRANITVSNLVVCVGAYTSTATSSGTFVGLYTPSGTSLTQVVGSSDVGATLTAGWSGITRGVALPFSSSVALTANQVYYGAIIIDLSTMPTIGAWSATGNDYYFNVGAASGETGWVRAFDYHSSAGSNLPASSVVTTSNYEGTHTAGLWMGLK